MSQIFFRYFLILFFTTGVIIFVSYDYNVLLQDKILSELKRLELIVGNNKIRNILFFMIMYSCLIALSIPIGTFLTILGGFLFGPVIGTLACATSATIGAILIHLIIKLGFGSTFKVWVEDSKFFTKLEDGIGRNVWTYLLFSRLFPLVPFWFANIAPAILGVRLFPFIVTTFFGILPATFIIAWAGSSMQVITQLGRDDNFSLTNNLPALASLVAIAILVLLPMVLNNLWEKK